MNIHYSASDLREVAEVAPRSATPQICMPTWRNFTRKTYRCGYYEAEDILTETANVDLIHLDMTWGAWFDEHWLRSPIYHDVSKRLVFANPGLKKVRLTRDYDAFIVACKTLWDLPYVNAIAKWRDHCKVSVCWIDELWASDIRDYRYWLPALRQFDFVFSGLRGTVSALSQAIDRPCYWLPGGVDALRFGPLIDSPARTIDVYSIGRRHEGMHREVAKAAARCELFYVYDTHRDVAAAEVYDYRQHRELFASMAKRSRYFMVATAKTNELSEKQGQVEVGHRYFEGAAAGTVMIGEAPDCDAYRELFAWSDAVIQVRPDGSDVMSILEVLNSDPERTAAIGRRNARETLLRHDWVYRWAELLRIAGIEASSQMAARKRRLQDMANLISIR